MTFIDCSRNKVANWWRVGKLKSIAYLGEEGYHVGIKKILISGVVIVLIVPQVALASWWNPISWFRKQPAQTATQVQLVKTATSTATEIEDLQKRIDDLKKQQPVVVPTTSTPVIKKKLKWLCRQLIIQKLLRLKFRHR